MEQLCSFKRLALFGITVSLFLPVTAFSLMHDPGVHRRILLEGHPDPPISARTATTPEQARAEGRTVVLVAFGRTWVVSWAEGGLVIAL